MNPEIYSPYAALHVPACLARPDPGMIPALGQDVLQQERYFNSREWRRCCEGDQYGIPPWVQMPPDGRRFQPSNAIALPAPASAGVDQLVFLEQVPLGWDGIINTQTNLFTSTGFSEGTGDILWRLEIDRWWPKNCGAINTTLGGFSNAYPLEGGGVRVYSGQQIRYWVAVSLAGLGVLAPAGRLYARIGGWYWPKR